MPPKRKSQVSAGSAAAAVGAAAKRARGAHEDAATSDDDDDVSYAGASFATLPEEALLHLFNTFLDEREVLMSACVCRTWHDLIHDPERGFWKRQAESMGIVAVPPPGSSHLALCRLPMLLPKRVVPLFHHDRNLQCVGVRGRRVVSGGSDRLAVLCIEKDDGTFEYKSAAMHPLPVGGIDVDDTYMLTGCFDRAVSVFDATTLSEVACITGHRYAISCVQLHRTENYYVAITGSLDKTIRCWDLTVSPPQESLVLKGHKGRVRSLYARGSTLVSGDAFGVVRVWDLATGAGEDLCKVGKVWMEAVALTPDGTRVVTGDRDGNICVWDVESHDLVCTLKGHKDAVCALTILDNIILSTGEDGMIITWNMDTRTCINVFDWQMPILCMSMDTEARRVVVGGGDGDAKMQVWDF